MVIGSFSFIFQKSAGLFIKDIEDVLIHFKHLEPMLQDFSK